MNLGIMKSRAGLVGAVTLLAPLVLAPLACSSESANGGGLGSGGARSMSGSGGTGTGGGGGVGGGPGATGSGGAPVGAGTGGSGGGGELALPVIVTSYYNNQGWFGDAALMTYFTAGSTVIRQVTSTAGPCAARTAPPRGNCLEVTYTPPPGLSQPAAGGAYVGVFLLTTLAMAHPELTPPANVGEPNWGVELGKHIAPGATRIAFQAAAAIDGTVVRFKAGTAADAFTLPDQLETLTTTWTPRSLAIAGINYGTSVVGAFAWVLTDTTRPVTFYLDGIVWE